MKLCPQKEHRWVRMAEVLPALHSNVHHAVVYVRPLESSWLRYAPVGTPFTAATLTDPEDRRGAHWTNSDVLLVYAPGSSPDAWPKKNGETYSCGLGPCLSNTLHRQRPRGFRSIQHRTDFFETRVRAARADAAAHERPFRDTAGCAELPGPSSRHSTQRRYAAQFFPAHAPPWEALRVQPDSQENERGGQAGL